MKKIMFNDKYCLTKAVLDGRKKQTRIIITCPQTFKGQYVAGFNVYKSVSDGFISEICMYDADERDFEGGQIVQKYRVGEIVAIAQSYHTIYDEFGLETMDMIVTKLKEGKGWTNKMFVKPELMPHQIRITNVRIERLQDISDDDCLAEGIIKGQCGSADTHFMDAYYVPNEIQPYCTPKDAYAVLIDKVGKKGDWCSNPYVFVYNFEVVK